MAARASLALRVRSGSGTSSAAVRPAVVTSPVIITQRTTVGPGTSMNRSSRAKAAAPAMAVWVSSTGSSSGVCHRSRPSHWANRKAV